MALPDELRDVLAEHEEPGGRDEAWAAFLARYTPLLLKTARSLGGSRDDVMDRYAYIVEQLEADGFRRLRVFRDDNRATFVTWLVVTARRLCLDHYRHRYGRAQPSPTTQSTDRRGARRSLADLLGADIEIGDVADTGPAPDARVSRESQRAALREVLVALPCADQMLLALRFEDGLSAREIAEILELATPFQVYRRLDRVLAGLRATLRRDAFDAG